MCYLLLSAFSVQTTQHSAPSQEANVAVGTFFNIMFIVHPNSTAGVDEEKGYHYGCVFRVIMSLFIVTIGFSDDSEDSDEQE